MEVATKRLLASASKNTGVVLLPRSRMNVHPYGYFWWCGSYRGLGVQTEVRSYMKPGFE